MNPFVWGNNKMAKETLKKYHEPICMGKQ